MKTSEVPKLNMLRALVYLLNTNFVLIKTEYLQLFMGFKN